MAAATPGRPPDGAHGRAPAADRNRRRDAVKLQLIAVGERPPGWVRDGFADYAGRLPRQWDFSLTEIAPARRARGPTARQAMADEAQRLLAALPPASRAQAVALAVDGAAWSTEQLAARLDGWQHDGRDVALVVGGPDGLDESVLARCQTRWSLSPLTFPHALVRVLVAEQIYRAWSILNHHPYHRA